jgi:hypothetical protein
VSPFEPHESPCYACEVRNVLTLVYFSILRKNPGWVPDCQRLEQLGLWSTSQLSLWSGLFTWRSKLSFRCLLYKIISFIISTLYIKHCHLILPLFVAIYEIWLPGLTYSVYLVLFLKPGVTLYLLKLFKTKVCSRGRRPSSTWSSISIFRPQMQSFVLSISVVFFLVFLSFQFCSVV